MMLFNAVSAATSVTPPSVNAKRSGAHLGEIKNLTKDFPAGLRAAVVGATSKLEASITSAKHPINGHIGVFPNETGTAIQLLFSPSNDRFERTGLTITRNGTTTLQHSEPNTVPRFSADKSGEQITPTIEQQVKAFAKAIGLAEPENK